MEDDLKNLKNEEKNLGVNENDVIVWQGKKFLSLIPFVGSFFAELIAFTIPNQRQDRLENFNHSMAKVLYGIDDSIKNKIVERFKEPESVLFIEKVLKQVIESESKERFSYLSSIVKNGLSGNIDSMNRERLLKIFNQLNEIEILRLYGASLNQFNDDEKSNSFFDKYENELFYEAEWGADDEENEREEIIRSYSQNLVNMGLMTKTDDSSKTTILGNALIKFIDAEEHIEI